MDPSAHQGQYYGNGGAGVGQPNNMMLQMGLSYGHTLLNEGLQRGEESFISSYLPIFSKLQNYYCVDNTYVRKKLGILTFPFVRRFPPPAAAQGGDTVAGGGVGKGFDQQPPFSPFGSPTVDNAAGPLGGSQPTTERSAPLPLPINDSLAFDLYIPTMGAVTYIIISAFLYGLVHKRTVTSDYLLATATAVALWSALEMTAVKVLAYALKIVHGAALLDIAALCGYKYTLMCIVVLVKHVLGLERVLLLYMPLILYVAAANGFFTVKSLIRLSTREDGRVPPRARLYAFACAGVQIPVTLWLCLRPFQ